MNIIKTISVEEVTTLDGTRFSSMHVTFQGGQQEAHACTFPAFSGFTPEAAAATLRRHADWLSKLGRAEA
ncbi:hypothetical protein BcepIL02_gp39 [Burkholderia phage BcepIL02]|uniref:Uncharacterized protein n=1 Tax=Burkholderia phage BcepIL02 TaxID=2886898 RepID=C5IHN1_9CAUD|nr:hypothetical protein BcepIL02_gp39 [Burkholderia phage BcepIL02]ACR15032.1 hypothetical protein BcepIL02_gp39 [Burkholderia phage BcepIL02]